MPQAQLSPELGEGVLHLARALMAALRSWTLYPPEHPAVGQSIDRLTATLRRAGPAISFGVTPDTLLIEGAPADATQPAIAECAALLHDRDLLRVTIAGDVPPDAVRSFLRLLSLDAAERRERGGPARIWADEDQSCIALEQIDYQTVLEREGTASTESARRDDVWKSIVESIAAGSSAAFDERALQRLIAISGSPTDVADLATAVMGPKCAGDGSPMVTSQAATVLAAFRHLTSVVSVMSPERVPAVMNNLATATSALDPHVVIQLLRSEDQGSDAVGLVKGVAAAFDDARVAQLLATALALDGHPSDRLATVFNTIAPDDERKRRVLTLTRQMLNETDFGRRDQFEALWGSMEELLVSYNERPFVSDAYRSSLDELGARAERMAAADLPDELDDWMQSLGEESVRGLSVTLLLDLLMIEQDSANADDLARDLGALAEDLLLAGAYDDVQRITGTLAARASGRDLGREAARQALDRLGESAALTEAALMAGELDDAAWTGVVQIATAIGPAAVAAFAQLTVADAESRASARGENLIVSLGAGAISRLGALAGDPRWQAQRAAARMLGRIGTADAVPLLQPLVRKGEPRVVREAIAALSGIDDPSAARAVHTVLRAAGGDVRRAVADALVADRDPRVIPMLTRILDESDLLGADHEVALESIAALGAVGHDDATPALAKVAGRRAWLRRAKLRAVKTHAVDALRRIHGPRATAALQQAAATGDWMLRKIAATQS